MNLNLCEEYQSMQIFMMEKGDSKDSRSDWVFKTQKLKFSCFYFKLLMNKTTLKTMPIEPMFNTKCMCHLHELI